MRFHATGVLLLMAALSSGGCAAKKPPPPVIETQEAELGGGGSAPDKAVATKDPAPAEAPTATSPVPDDAAPKPLGGTASVGSTPQVKLLEPGKAPRRAAKHAFKAGSSQALMMKSKTRVSGNLPVPTLTLDGPIKVKITEVNGDGAARFTLNAGPFKQGQSAPKAGGLGGMLGGLLGGLGGGAASAMGGGPPEKIVGWGWINPQGSVTEFHVQEGAQDDSAPVEVGDAFPVEPIGVGARWEVRVTLEEKDGPVEQTSTYELLSFNGKTLKAKVKRVQVPSGGSSDEPGGGQSEGVLTFRLGSVYATGKMQMSKALKVNLPGMDAARFKMTSDVDIQQR